MKNIIITTTPTKIADAGNRDFLHVYNDAADVVYIQYDGGNAEALLTTDSGYPLQPGATLVLDNVGPRMIYNKAVYGIIAAGTGIVRVQGDGA